MEHSVVFQVVSVLLFGCECWTITAVLQRKLQSFYRRCARTIFGINMWHVWQYHISTDTVLDALGLPSIVTIISKRTLMWFGQIYRVSWDRLPRKLLTCWVATPRTSGNVASWGRTDTAPLYINDRESHTWKR